MACVLRGIIAYNIQLMLRLRTADGVEAGEDTRSVLLPSGTYAEYYTR